MKELRTVYKYMIEITDRSVVKMPRRASVLSVHTQRDQICIWALVDPGEPETEERVIRVHGTGRSIMNAEMLMFIGSVLMHGEALVFHVFEELSAKGSNR